MHKFRSIWLLFLPIGISCTIFMPYYFGGMDESVTGKSSLRVAVLKESIALPVRRNRRRFENESKQTVFINSRMNAHLVQNRTTRVASMQTVTSDRRISDKYRNSVTKIYNITRVDNPEMRRCPFAAYVRAPALQKQNCRGDINMIWSVATISIEGSTSRPVKAIVHNPVQTAGDVRDASLQALFVADPFLFPRPFAGNWYMFTEILDAKVQKGKIGLHISTNDRKTFNYNKIVIEEPWHLSFPYVIEEPRGSFFMTTSGTSGIRSKPYFLWLYKATDFPYKWKREIKILDDQTESAPVDPAIVKHNHVFFLFIRDVNIGNDGLERLFYSKTLLSKFEEHPESRRYNIRQSGRIVYDPDRMIPGWVVFHHTDKSVFGVPLRILSESHYEYGEKEQLLHALPQQTTWASAGMHTLSLVRMGKNKWFGATDGWRDDSSFSVLGCLARGYKAARCQSRARDFRRKNPSNFVADMVTSSFDK